MRDFSLRAYKDYVLLIRERIGTFLTFKQFLGKGIPPESFCLLRHDVDRKPRNALAMAELESQLGISATYYFRAKPSSFKREIVQAVQRLGHEVGYHYESLSDANGEMEKAVADFRRNLERFREFVPISTCSMHGRPLKPYDNRDIWRDPARHHYLVHELRLLGEIYLDIDYSDIAYINDTGRNWSSGKSNVRDKVLSNVPVDFASARALRSYLSHAPHPRMVFQVHPERWTDDPLDWTLQWTKDAMINPVKFLIESVRSRTRSARPSGPMTWR